mmetsp:Transcript_67430/g.206498  ORF Transcript_67430/g.206498 Transcript_67430/m.206498 type:complete len:500 (-) Transcript_67430:121-1620(-)
MEAARLCVEDRPHGKPIGQLDREAACLEGRVRLGNEPVDVIRHGGIRLNRLRLLQPLQECVHRCHDEGMSRERTDDVVDPRGLLGIPTGHEFLRPADDADGQTAAERFAVAHDVGLDVVGALRASGVHAEPRVDLVEDEGDVAPSAHRAELMQPLLVPRGRPHLTVVGFQDGVARRGLVQVEALQGVDQHSGDLAAAGLEHPQGQRAHVLQAQDVVRYALVARDWLHAVPPTVVGPAEGDAQRLVRVEPGDPHGAHHGLGAGHVEGHLWLVRNLPEHGDVVEHGLVQGAQEKPLLLGVSPPLLDELLVLLVAADVDAVGAADVHRAVAIEVHHVDALGPLERHRRVQVLLDDAVERREAPGGGEAEVRDHLLQLEGKLLALRVLLLPLPAQLLDGSFAASGNFRGASIAGEEICFVDRVFREEVLRVREEQRQWVCRGDGQHTLVQNRDRARQQQRREDGNHVVIGQASQGGQSPPDARGRRSPTITSLLHVAEGHQQK